MNPSASKCRNRAASRWVSPTVQSSSSRTSTCATVSCAPGACRSEEHTSELQSQSNLVCRLLLEKKKQNMTAHLSIERLHLSLAFPPADSQHVLRLHRRARQRLR